MKEFKIDLSMYEGKVRNIVSEAVQEKAFELGYGGWLSCGKNIAHSDMPYLFIGLNDIGMCEDYQRKDFKDYPRPEISAADFLALTPEDVKDAPKEPEFKPFDRVLVRNDDDDEWHIDFFEGMNKDKDEPYTYQCINSFWRHCIPYEGNEHLLGTMEDVK